MGSNEYQASTKQDSEETLPSLIPVLSSNGIKGFDNVEANYNPHVGQSAQDTEAAASDNGSVVMSSEMMQSISISMPPSLMEAHLHNAKRVLFSHHGDTIITSGNLDNTAPSNMDSKQTVPFAQFHSQQMPTGSSYREAVSGRNFPKDPDVMKDKRYDLFKTRSGRLERQLSNFHGKPCGAPSEDGPAPNAEIETLPVDRYFDALEGPELETLRAAEEIVLPADERWPFLLRYPITSFGICLGVSSQAIMWKALATSASMKFLHINLTINLILWCISVALVAVVSSIYLLKVIFYFEAVRREYYHPIRVNFFFTPWITLLLVVVGLPPSVATNLPPALWYVLMTPIFGLELKIYGQWMSGGQRRLSKVANPSNHLSIVGNFVGAFLGASMGLKEGPLFFFAVGLAHYAVLFVTLYQRLPTNETLPKDLHPVFFLFVAAPSVASISWAKIQGSFDYGSRIAYFIALFLYFSLAVRVNFFRGFRFSLAWWAYTVPMTAAAIATTRYANGVTNVVTQVLSVTLSSIATLTMTVLLVTTILHAFVLHDLFPNDIAIAISERRPKRHRKWFHSRHGGPDTRDIKNYLKFASSESKDIEASLGHPSSDTHGECKLPM